MSCADRLVSACRLHSFSVGLPATKVKAYGKTEAELSGESPFDLPNRNPFLHYSRQDVNGDGKITNADHVPDSTILPSLFPIAVFVKLNDGVRIGSQASPTIVLQGLTIYNTLSATAGAPAERPQVAGMTALRLSAADAAEHPWCACTHGTEAESACHGSSVTMFE